MGLPPPGGGVRDVLAVRVQVLRRLYALVEELAGDRGDVCGHAGELRVHVAGVAGAAGGDGVRRLDGAGDDGDRADRDVLPGRTARREAAGLPEPDRGGGGRAEALRRW